MESPSLRYFSPLPAGRLLLRSAWRVEFNGLLLFALIGGYFGALIFAADWLLGAAIGVREWIPVSEGALTANILLRLVVFSALVLVLVRLVWTLGQVLYGLVTGKHDQEVYQKIEGIVLAGDANPAVYALVEEVARRVGAPPPDVIYVNQHPNCYALELRQFGFSTRRRLILVLGLPHLEVLTVGELEVILAHELVHFRGDTRIAVFAFRFFESLRATAASSRSPWWSALDPIHRFSQLYIQLFLLLSSPVRRRQELRADCWSAATYGGAVAGRTLLKEWQIGAQFDTTLASFRPESCAPLPRREGNVFRWFRCCWRELSPAGYDYLRSRLEAEEKSTFWDSHPTITRRLEAMRPFPEIQAPAAQPAHELVADLTALEERLHQRVFHEPGALKAGGLG
jgi:Zn-dependent protease with chaperone function